MHNTYVQIQISSDIYLQMCVNEARFVGSGKAGSLVSTIPSLRRSASPSWEQVSHFQHRALNNNCSIIECFVFDCFLFFDFFCCFPSQLDPVGLGNLEFHTRLVRSLGSDVAGRKPTSVQTAISLQVPPGDLQIEGELTQNTTEGDRMLARPSLWFISLVDEILKNRLF